MQQHPISTCQPLADKKECVARAWKEYSTAILLEYRSWRQFQEIAKSGDSKRAGDAVKRALDGGWYIHNHWETCDKPYVYDYIPYDSVDKIIACRAAIINIKFWLAAIASGTGADPSDATTFSHSAKNCEGGKK
jgi:hypothetical protein